MTAQQRRRARARAAGKCGTCGVREVDEGRHVCQVCSDGVQDRKRWARAAAPDRWCDECLRFEGHRYDCKVAPPLLRDPGPLLPRQGEFDAQPHQR